eukprot:4125874-Pyramimonas_sp.AAC.1
MELPNCFNLLLGRELLGPLDGGVLDRALNQDEAAGKGFDDANDRVRHVGLVPQLVVPVRRRPLNARVDRRCAGIYDGLKPFHTHLANVDGVERCPLLQAEERRQSSPQWTHHIHAGFLQDPDEDALDALLLGDHLGAVELHQTRRA